MSPAAPRIVNDVSYVTRINDSSQFSWQAQHLAMLQCHFSWQAQYLVMSECHFSSLFVAGAVCGEIWIDSRGTKCCNFRYKTRCRGGKSNLGERADSVLQFHARIMLELAAHCK